MESDVDSGMSVETLTMGPVIASRDYLFDGQTKTEGNFGGTSGIRRGPAFTAVEIATINALIQEKICTSIRNVSPDMARELDQAGLEDYHQIVSADVHQQCLSKMGRILDADAVAEISQTALFDYFRDELGEFFLSDEEQIGRPQICFRIVRPNEPRDTGTLHRDTWFWEHFNFTRPKGYGRIKCWTQVSGDPDMSGLLLVPQSHLRNVGYRTEMVDGKLGFVQEFPIDESQLKRYVGKLGEPVIFNHDTLHVGALNKGSRSRVSFEFTIVFKEQNNGE